MPHSVHSYISPRHKPKNLLTAVLLAALLALAGCGGGGSDSTPPAPNVNVSGKVTYDSVPAIASAPNAQGNRSARLDYTQTMTKPARGVQVEAVADDGTVLAATQTDAAGSYTLAVPANTNIRLRAKARLLQAAGGSSSWDFSVRDNTSAGYAVGGTSAALYAVEGTPFSSGSANQARDLNAASGWGGSGYTGPRAAAPFAILDQIYAAKQKVLAVDGKAVFAPMIAYWSTANRPADGNPASGNISTSHWSAGGTRPGLYILGAENVDTDEYDSGVIVHEWGHYFESSFSRADSIGGPHGAGDLLDMRVSFGEGWGNSLAGMVRDDPLYVDTAGPQQSRTGVVLDLDTIDASEPRGWFNEASVQYVLYQWYKTPALGFASIYNVMVNQQKNTEAFTSLFSFATYLRGNAAATGQSAIDQYLAGINTVNGAALDIWGTAQTWPSYLAPANQVFALPVYTPLTLGQQATLCNTEIFGDVGNKLGNNRYLRVRIAQSGAYRVKITANPAVSAFAFNVFLRGQNLQPAQVIDASTALFNLAAGDYTATVTADTATCFNVALTQ